MNFSCPCPPSKVQNTAFSYRPGPVIAHVMEKHVRELNVDDIQSLFRASKVIHNILGTQSMASCLEPKPADELEAPEGNNDCLKDKHVLLNG